MHFGRAILHMVESRRDRAVTKYRPKDDHRNRRCAGKNATEFIVLGSFGKKVMEYVRSTITEVIGREDHVMLQSSFGSRVRSALTTLRPAGRPRARRPRAARFSVIESLEARALLAMTGVDVVNSAFAPSSVTIHVGDTVEWVWDSSHLSTTSVKGSSVHWNSGVLSAGVTFEQTFNQVGTFAYYSTVGGNDNGNGTASGMSGTVIVLPDAPLTSITLMPRNYTLAEGTAQQLMAMGNYADNTTEDLSDDVTWSSSNPAVATVSDASGTRGLVSTVSPGTTTITASSGGQSGSTQVTVTAPPVSDPPPVTVTSVQAMQNQHHLVAEIVVHFSGPVSASEAADTGMYHLTMTGSKDSFIARNARVVKLASAFYDAALDEVILKPKRPVSLANCVQVVIDGQQPGGLQDSLGRVINGNRDGQPGGNVVAMICRTPIGMDAMLGMAPAGSSIIVAELKSMIVPDKQAGSLRHSTAKSR
jgi:plastocyanin